MADSTYIKGRKQYRRPQAIMLSDSIGRVDGGIYTPDEDEVEFEDFIILSDHNRKGLSFSTERIEQRKRMINGRMRSVHIADKVKLSVSWDLLPSRGFAGPAAFGADGKPAISVAQYQHTADGGAGGVELLNWYKNHPGSFWVFLAYDNYRLFPEPQVECTHLPLYDGGPPHTVDCVFNKMTQYNERKEMYFADFSYDVEKRGATTYDMWNISLSLEEV